MKVKHGFWRVCMMGGVLVLTAAVGTYAMFTQYFVGILGIIALAMMLVVSATQRG